MTDSLRITVAELRKRMEAGEDFVVIDTRNPREWASSDVKIPEAIRVETIHDDVFASIPKEKPIVAYCT